MLPPLNGDGWVAVGIGHHGEHDRSPLWWTSSDGATWATGAVDSITADGPNSGFVGVARSGAGLAALGQAYSGIARQRAAAGVGARRRGCAARGADHA